MVIPECPWFFARQGSLTGSVHWAIVGAIGQEHAPEPAHRRFQRGSQQHTRGVRCDAFLP
jgi:hypothetical protein